MYKIDVKLHKMHIENLRIGVVHSTWKLGWVDRHLKLGSFVFGSRLRLPLLLPSPQHVGMVLTHLWPLWIPLSAPYLQPHQLAPKGPHCALGALSWWWDASASLQSSRISDHPICLEKSKLPLCSSCIVRASCKMKVKKQ